eukprot:TRINITY_DN10009_c0_g1_i1.p1 TRINITY_DN10009_c0_g1~~TRINITY_DN10009_c0_g1_i1.p1  ORF type:complete len:640 (-),score=274.16 TRINITY_DN10009_c0_g1_i1:25-1944(-)
MAEVVERKANRKKGKSFIQKAKKFGKQGQRGKGTEIEQDQYDYLVRVMERWRDGFENDEEKTMFVENVFEQTEGEERKLCGNQLASRVIELILPAADHKVIARFCSALAEDLRLVCVDPFMSHVLEKLLIIKTFHAKDKKVEVSEEQMVEGREWVLKVCRFVTNNLEDFSHDLYASHLLRTCTQCLAGQRSPQKCLAGQGGGQRTEGYDSRVEWSFGEGDQESFADVLDTFATRILSLSADTITSEMCVHVLQVFMEVVNMTSPKLVKSVVKHLLSTCLTGETIDWDSVPTVRLLECVVKVGINSEKLSKKIFSKILEGKILELAVHPVGNFVIQRVFENISDKEKFGEVCSELTGHMEDILSSGCTGVILSLTKACVRLETQQASVLTELTSALHCTESQDQLAPCMAYMVTKDAMAEEGKVFSVHLHGSLALQQLLIFGKPIKLVRSLLAMTSSQLSSLLGDPRGCHITDIFMTSKTIGEKSREALVKALKGEFVSLACSKHGSRTVDTLWKHSSMKHRQAMVEDLATKVDVLSSNRFGKFVAQNCFVAIYKRSKEDWRNLVEKGDKIGDMFTEIIGDTKPAVKRKVEKDETVKEEPAVKKADKKEVSDIVDDWLNSDTANPPKKKKKKAKSYLDDL